MPANLALHADPKAATAAPTLLFIGRRDALLADTVVALLPEGLDTEVFKAMVRSGDPGDAGRSQSTWLDATRRVVVGVLPEVCSRHNAPSRAWAIPRLVQAAGLRGHVGIVVALSEAQHASAAALAVARAHGLANERSKSTERNVDITLLAPDGSGIARPNLEFAMEGVRRAAMWVDLPPNKWNTNAFVDYALALEDRHDNVTTTVIRGDELEAHGLNGIYNVGKAGAEPPALIVLDYQPPSAVRSLAWVGKGIVYDTGGLALKSKTGMPGMKMDMGGAAAVLAAFESAAQIGVPHQITAVLCVAENAIGPTAMRPDDVFTMYSGKTVEINNPDAEGRLVLGDGVAWVTRHRSPDVLVDMATLTGAQAAATGKLHAALYCNDDDLEARAISCGRSTGDLVHPLPYAPELFRKEFSSAIADMRNSVKDRANAQSSCAGQFVGNHLGRYDKPWLHIDMAAPAKSGGRATGWGVGLLLGLADAI